MMEPSTPVALWRGGNPGAGLDAWFCPAFGDTHAAFAAAFRSPLAHRARIFILELPGHGRSPPVRGRLTVARAAAIWHALLRRHSHGRRVLLVGHSMAAVIAARVARRLARPPALVIGVEGNLTSADACLTGLARRCRTPEAFAAALRMRVRMLARQDTSSRGFSRALARADTRSLWTLGRSITSIRDPGLEFRRLRCPWIHYWDVGSMSDEARTYIARHRLPNRRLDGLGHWPMRSAPARFYRAILEDLAAARR